MEFDAGTLYATFAQQMTGQMAFGELNPLNGAFNQLRVYDAYLLGGSNGITGLVVVDPGAVVIGMRRTADRRTG